MGTGDVIYVLPTKGFNFFNKISLHYITFLVLDCSSLPCFFEVNFVSKIIEKTGFALPLMPNDVVPIRISPKRTYSRLSLFQTTNK